MGHSTKAKNQKQDKRRWPTMRLWRRTKVVIKSVALAKGIPPHEVIDELVRDKYRTFYEADNAD